MDEICININNLINFFSTVSDDRTNRLFDLRSGKEIHAFKETKGFATHLDFHPSGTCIGVGTSDKKVKVYDLRMQRLQQVYSSHTGPVSQVSFHPNGNYLGKNLDNNLQSLPKSFLGQR